MLKIKESEWNRFCANANKLGYELDGKKYIEISCGEKQLRIDANTKRITVVSNNKPYASTYDKLFDLIVQGYVEKELEEVKEQCRYCDPHESIAGLYKPPMCKKGNCIITHPPQSWMYVEEIEE